MDACLQILTRDVFLFRVGNVEQDENIQGDPFNTLFVARLSYDLQEEDLLREFEMYGPIKHVRTLPTIP